RAAALVLCICVPAAAELRPSAPSRADDRPGSGVRSDDRPGPGVRGDGGGIRADDRPGPRSDGVRAGGDDRVAAPAVRPPAPSPAAVVPPTIESSVVRVLVYANPPDFFS